MNAVERADKLLGQILANMAAGKYDGKMDLLAAELMLVRHSLEDREPRRADWEERGMPGNQ